MRIRALRVTVASEPAWARQLTMEEPFMTETSTLVPPPPPEDESSRFGDGAHGVEDPPTRGHIGRIVAGCVVGGFLAAAGLVVGPLAGSREHVITGATLVVFASILVAPETTFGLLRAVDGPITLAGRNGLTRLLGNAVMQTWGMRLTVEIIIELLPVVYLCVPPLLVALIGGWIARRPGPGRPIVGAAGGDHVQGAIA